MHPVNSVTLLGVIINGPAKVVSLNTPYKNKSKNIAQLMVCSFMCGASDLSV